MQSHISYRKVRDLSGVFNATFGFIKQNFKAFFTSLLLFSGPFIIIYSTIASVAFGSVFNFSRIGTVNPALLTNLIAAYVISMIAILIGISVYNVILIKAVVENENLAPDEKLTVKSITNGFFSHYWRSLANMLIFALVSGLLFVVIMFFFIGMFKMIFDASIILGILIIIVLFVSGFIYMPVLCYVPLAALFVSQRDQIGIFPATAKVFRYLKNNFWNTWVLSFISLLTYSVMSMVAQLPVLIITLISTISKIGHYGQMQESASPTLIIITGICALLTFGVMSIYYLMCIYHFGNLEEKNEGLRVLEKINTI